MNCVIIMMQHKRLSKFKLFSYVVIHTLILSVAFNRPSWFFRPDPFTFMSQVTTSGQKLPGKPAVSVTNNQ